MNSFAMTEMGLYLPADEWGQAYVDILNGPPRPPGLDAHTPVGVSLFTGAGGMDLGFVQAGYHVAVATDNDPASAATYLCNMARYGGVQIIPIEEGDYDRLDRYLTKEKTRKTQSGLLTMTEFVGSGWISNFPEVRGCEIYYFGDVRALTGERILSDLHMQPGDVDVVFGGPPCQGFSHAGQRNVMDERNSLVFDMARLIIELQPKAMVMENVPGIVSMVTPEGIAVVDAFCRILEDGDYGSYDTLRKSIMSGAGLGGALKKGKRKSRPMGEDADAIGAPGTLFEEAS